MDPKPKPIPVTNVHKIFEMFVTKKIYEPPEAVHIKHRVLIGTVAGMIATVLVHPLDLIKVRKLTYPYPSTITRMAQRIVRCQGYLALYSGLTAGLLRQGTNTSTRLAVYNSLYDDRNKETKLTENQKMLLGTVAGLAGAILGSPSEIVLVRIMAASAPRAYNLDPDLQKLINNRYKNCFDGIRRIVVEEGPLALFRGGTLTLARSVLLSIAQIGSYSVIRDKLVKLNMTEGYSLHTLTTLASSFVSTVLTLPIDLVKTRYQIKSGGVTMVEILEDVRRRRGILGLWSRSIFIPYYFRLIFHSMSSFFVSENLLKIQLEKVHR